MDPGGRPGRTGAAPPVRPWLRRGLHEFAPAKLEIQGADDTKVTLTREGEGWGIDEADGYPVAEGKVDELLDTLKELQVRRPVVTSSRYHRALKVTDDDHERRVRIWKDASGGPEIDFFLGTAPNYQRTHIRKKGDDRVFEAQGLGSYDVQARSGSWFQPTFVDVQLDQVDSLRLSNGEGTFEIEKGDDGAWSVTSPPELQGRVLDTSKVESLVRGVASLRAAEPAGKREDESHGLGSPRATAVLRYTETSGDVGAPEAKEITLWVGGVSSDDENRAYVARSGFDFVAETYKTSVDKLLEQKVADLEPDASDS
jgi:hypothetical protein